MALMPGTRFNPHLARHSRGRVRFAWMAGRALDLPDRTIEPLDVQTIRILSLGKTSFRHHTVERWLSKGGDAPRVVDLSNSMGAVASLTQVGVGVSLLPVECCRAAITSGALRVLRTCPEGPPSEFFSVHEADAATSISSLRTERAAASRPVRMTPARAGSDLNASGRRLWVLFALRLFSTNLNLLGRMPSGAGGSTPIRTRRIGPRTGKALARISSLLR